MDPISRQQSEVEVPTIELVVSDVLTQIGHEDPSQIPSNALELPKPTELPVTTMATKKRGRPAKKHAQPDVSEMPATPLTQSTSFEAARTPVVAKKRGRPSFKAESSSDASTPRKRGRPRKKQHLTPALTHSSKVIADSQEKMNKMRDNQAPDDFNQGIKDAMKEIFIRNAIEQDGGLFIPRETALKMQQAFAPMSPVPEGDVFVPTELVQSIRKHLH